MVKVLVLGATGYIGNAVARALAAAGYEVYGMTRDESKSAALERDEITPVIGDIRELEDWEDELDECSVLINCAADYADMEGLDRIVTDAFAEAAQRAPMSKTAIVTGGMWSYGDTEHEVIDETSPFDPPDFLEWKPEHEERFFLDSNLAARIILVPGIAYGRSGSLPGVFMKQAEKDERIVVAGNGTNFWPTVHVDDLAQAYLKVVDGNLTGGHIFFVTANNERVADMVDAVARTAEVDSVEYVGEPRDNFGKSLCLSIKASAQKAHRILGWYPKHLSFVDGVERYHAAFMAHENSA